MQSLGGASQESFPLQAVTGKEAVTPPVTTGAEEPKKVSSSSQEAVKPSKKRPKDTISNLPSRSIPSQQIWRAETVFGRIVNFFEQSVFFLDKIWPNRPSKVDQRLMATLHADRIAADYPRIQTAPLSRVLKYLIPFLEKQEGDSAPTPQVLKSLKKTAKWASKLENASKYAKHSKQLERLGKLSQEINSEILSLKPGEFCVIPGGWFQSGEKNLHNAFYKVTRNEDGKYTFQIISRDVHLNPQHIVLIPATGARLHPITTFKGLTQAEVSDPIWLQSLLYQQMPSREASGKDPDSKTIPALFAHLTEHLQEAEPSSEAFRKFKTKETELKDTLLIVDMLSSKAKVEGAKVKEPNSERKKLRLKVESLFQFYAVARPDLANNETNQILLLEGIQSISKLASLLYAEGKLSDAEISFLNYECGLIENDISQAKETQTSKKNPFKSAKATPYVFKGEKIHAHAVNSKWISTGQTQNTQPVQTVNPPSATTLTEAVSKAPIPKPKIIGIYKPHLENLKTECEKLFAEEKDYELQTKIMDMFYELKLTHEGISQEDWGNEIEESAVLLADLTEKLLLSSSRTDSLTPEKRLLVIKAVLIQENLGKLNPDVSYNRDVKASFIKAAITETIGSQDFFKQDDNFDYGEGVYLRSYSQREVQLQKLLKEIRSFSSWYKTRNVYFGDQNAKSPPLSRQEKIMNAQNKLIKEFIPDDFFNLTYHTGSGTRQNYASSWSKKYQYPAFAELARTLRIGTKASMFNFSSSRSIAPTEQAIRDNPRAIISHLKVDDERLPDISDPDLADLMVALSRGSVLEMMGLIKQKPHLLAEPDIRALLEQITFGAGSLSFQLAGNPNLSKELAFWIDEQANSFKKQGKIHEFLFIVDLANSLNKAAPDLHPAQGIFFNFNYYNAIRELAFSSLDPSKPEFDSRHAIWTHLLLALENREKLTGEQIADYLQGLSIIQSAPIEFYDPVHQARIVDFREKWKDPIKSFISDPEKEAYRVYLLNSILKANGVSLQTSSWKGQFPIYRAEPYEVNLLSGVVKNFKNGWISRSIPAEVRTKIKTHLSQDELRMARTLFSRQDNTDCYAFESDGQRRLIAVKDDYQHVYKEITLPDGGKSWLEGIEKDQIFGKLDQDIEPVSFGKSPIEFVKAVYQLKKQMKDFRDIPGFLNQPDLTFWIDPKKTSHIYVQNENQEIQYKLVFKKDGDKRKLKGVVDLRADSPGKGELSQIGYLSEDMHPIWQQLKALENPQNTTVWMKEGKIDHVELFRYNLNFAEKDGQVVCVSPKLNGWILPASPPEHLKKGLPNVLIMQHPTIASQYRMILPDQEIIEPDPLEAHFSAFQIFKQIWNSARGKVLSVESKDPVGQFRVFDKSSPKQDFWIFDIDPATAELHPIEDSSVSPFLYMAKLSLLNHQPERALELILQMETLPRQWDTQDLINIYSFIADNHLQSPDFIALKLQCALVAQRKGMPGSEELCGDCYAKYLEVQNKVTAFLKPKYSSTIEGKEQSIKARFYTPEKLKQSNSLFPDLIRSIIYKDKKKAEQYEETFLTRDRSQLESHFEGLYKTLTTSTPGAKDARFKKVDLTLRSLTREGGESTLSADYYESLQNFLNRVLEIRKAQPSIQFPEFPKLSPIKKYNLEEVEAATLKLNDFFQNLDQMMKGIEKGLPKPLERSIERSEFDFRMIADQIEDFFAAMAADDPEAKFDDITIGDLEKTLEKRTPERPTIELDPSIGQSIYTKKELESFFEPSKTKVSIPKLDLSDLKASPKIAVNEAAEFLDEGLKTAIQEFEATTPMTLIKGEDSRLALEKDLVKKQAELTNKRELARKDVLSIIQSKSSSIHELQRRAKLVKNVDMELLLKHFLQNDLEALAPNLPPDIDYNQLNSAIGNYLLTATEVQRIDVALSEVQQLSDQGLTPQSMSDLYTILTAERQFDPAKNPQLLLFEYESNLLLRGIQLEMVVDVQNDPTKVYIAPTGIGKTSVITVLASLMMADGTNLVTTIFPRQLFHENLADVENKLGKIYKRSVYPLEYNMNTPIVTKHGQPLFMKMYEDLMRVSIEKGIMVTTVESQQALEQKWILMMEQQSKMPFDRISDEDKQNLEYLTKILDFMHDRQKLVIDEIDKALSTREERHFKTGSTSDIPEHIWQNTLELYDRLMQEKELGLRENMQGKGLSDQKRQEILNKVARETARDIAQEQGVPDKANLLASYFLGEDESIWGTAANWSPEDQDKISLYKDQFQIFLPLTLAKTCNVKYMRSEIDGERTVPCLSSDKPKENSEPDEILEKVNYTIQDYLQTGIRELYIKRWVNGLKQTAESAVSNGMYGSIEETPEAELFQSVFPEHNLSRFRENQVPSLTQEINQDPERIKFFLKMYLKKMEISNSKISVDGHNLISMADKATGFSATTSSLRALPKALDTSETADKVATGNMVLDILRKAQNPDGSIPPVVRFDAANPKDIIPNILKLEPDTQVVIDGSGVAALHSLPHGTPAKQLLEGQPANSKIKGIIHQGKNNRQQVQTSKGEMDKEAAGLKPAVLGGAFDEGSARGADFKMAPEARAFITASDQQSSEEVLQTAGRLRKKGQRLFYGAAVGDPITDAGSLIKNSLVKSTEYEEDDINKGERKNLRDIVRREMTSELRKAYRLGGLEDLLTKYRDFKDDQLLVINKTSSYTESGGYAKAHYMINKPDKDPKDQINLERLKYLEIAKKHHLQSAVKELEDFELPKSIADRLTKKVRGFDGTVLDQEVEVEVQTEVETEIQTEIQIQESKDKIEYQDWLNPVSPKNSIRKLDSTNQAYDSCISYTQNFFPKNYQRQLHDRMQNPVHFIKIDVSASENPSLIEATFLDSLEASDRTVLRIPKLSKEDSIASLYDMRLKRFVKGPLAEPGSVVPDAVQTKLNVITSQARFFNGEIGGYSGEEFKALRQWLIDSKDDLEPHFKEIIKFKPQAQQVYPFSQIKKLFEEVKELKTVK